MAEEVVVTGENAIEAAAEKASAAAAGRAGASAHVHSGGVSPELEELEADSLGAVPMASSLSPTWLG